MVTGAGVVEPEVAAPPDAPPKVAVPESITNGVSGFMLSISRSTGMLGGAGAIVLAGVYASGVFIGIEELGGRNFVGKFSSGNGAPAWIGETISGVTITMSSVLVRVFCID